MTAAIGSRRRRWLIIGLWIGAATIAGGYQAKLSDAVTSDNRLFLPDGAEATQVRELLADEFPSGDTTSALVVYRRAQGLTDPDRSIMLREAGRFERTPGVVAVDQPGARVSRDGTVAVTTVTLRDGDSRYLESRIDRLRAQANGGAGLDAEITGAPAVSADALKVFSSVDLPLLLGTAALVVLILVAVYRSLLLALVPLGVVAIAYTVAAGLVYALIQAGMTVDGQSASLLIIVMFGAGTDYCLLLVARFREELAANGRPATAMRAALTRVAPTIVASALTVIAALLTLLLASFGSFRALGPVCAIGIAVVLLASLSLLPAVLVSVGPRRLRLDRHPERAPGSRAIGSLARRIADRPIAALAGSAALLCACALGLLATKADTNLLAGFRTETESQRGFELLRAGFRAGELAPLTVVATDLPTDRGRAVLDRIRATARELPGVADVRSPALTPDARTGRLDVVLRSDPYSTTGARTIEELRERLDRDLDANVRVGGAPAVQLDVRDTATRDLLVVAPVALLITGAILVALLRAVTAAAVALASVLLSFAGSFGAAVLLLLGPFGQTGIEPTVPVFAFVFLVALGVDYTIFLLARIREETATRDTRDAVVHALTSTAGVITSAGLVLAGTFAVLAAFPIDVMLQAGVIVALGVLVDTFVVRTVLLPAALAVLGERAWWPSRRREPVPPTHAR